MQLLKTLAVLTLTGFTMAVPTAEPEFSLQK